MTRFLLLLFAALWVATPARAAPRVTGPSILYGAQSYTLSFSAGDLSDSPAIGVSGSCSARFRQSGGDDVTLYAVTSATTPTASGTVLNAFTASTTAAFEWNPGTIFVKARATDATAGGSELVVQCFPSLGGKIRELPFASFPPSGNLPVIMGTDCADATCNAGGGTTRVTLYWDGGSYEPIDTAGGGGISAVVDDPTPELGGDLDALNRSMTNIGDATFESRIVQNAPADTTTATSPTHVTKIDREHWFNIDGQKSPVEGEGGGILKTKTVGEETDLVNLSESESYGRYTRLFGGGDTDLVGENMDVHATGGAQASGDEGASNFRLTNSDYWLTVFGTVTDPISSGAGAVTVPVGNVSPDESRMLGEGKMMVFTGSQQSVTVSDAPPGTINAGTLEDAGTIWASDGSATGQGVWTLGAGEVASTGVQSTGWCFSAVDSDYLDINAQNSNLWLPIDQVSGDTIRTRWQNQGFNARTPYLMLAGEGAAEGRVAPCLLLGQPVTSGQAVTSITATKGAGFPAIADDAVFQVASYPGIRQQGVFTTASRLLGTMYGEYGFVSNNLLSSQAGFSGVTGGRFQTSNAYLAEANGYNGAVLPDGNRHGWAVGYSCAFPYACEIGFYYRYSPDPDDLNFAQHFGELRFETEDWDDDVFRPVLSVYNDGTRSLSLDKTDGWGMNGEPFLRASVTDDSINSGVPNGSGAKVHWSQLLGVPAGFADNSDDGGGGGSLPVVDTTSIAEGSVDATKEVRLEVDGLTTGTVRVLTMPDANVDLGALTAANLAAGSLTAADAAADLATQAELDAKSAATSTDNTLPRFDSTAGDLQGSGVVVDDSNNVNIPGDISVGTGGTTDPSYMMFRDTDDAGYTECGWLNGVMTCATDADGVIDGTL